LRIKPDNRHIAGVKVLIDQFLPFQFAHGGANTQVEQTRLALERAGVEVEFLRWWDGGQRGDLVHYFGGVPQAGYLQQACGVRLPVIINKLFTETCNRSRSRLKRQGMAIKALLAMPFGEGIKDKLGWHAHQKCAHNVVGLEAERQVLQIVYQVPSERISVVPYGLSAAFMQAGPGKRHEPHLICTGTITGRKNFIELAHMARTAQTPVLFVGKPYHPDDPYWLRFKTFIDGQWVKHQPHVDSETEMIQLLQSARGFVLMSDYENWCLSAHEAAACGLPLLVPDQNWSRERFGDQARYFPTIGKTPENISRLKQFYLDAPSLPAPRIKLYSWDDVAQQLKAAYENVLARQT
jgi:glycosyltransferase involved in cell wall biosynthesis